MDSIHFERGAWHASCQTLRQSAIPKGQLWTNRSKSEQQSSMLFWGSARIIVEIAFMKDNCQSPIVSLHWTQMSSCNMLEVTLEVPDVIVGFVINLK